MNDHWRAGVLSREIHGDVVPVHILAFQERNVSLARA
jgi:hypothetical protein